MADRVSAVLSRPALTERLAADLLAAEWGIAGMLEPLPSERDRNVLVRIDGLPRHVLKVANHHEDRAFLELQDRVLERLKAGGVAVQAVVPTPAGETIVDVDVAGHRALARLLTWLPGKPLAAVPPSARSATLLEDLGCAMGRVARILAEVDGAAARQAFQWDVLRFEATLAGHLDAVVAADRRNLLDRARDRLAATLAPALPHLPRSLIHNDANDHNVLVDADATRVTGLLDLGDMVHSVTANEAAVAAAYAMLDAPEPLDVLASVARGFQAERPLAPPEAEALGELVIARLATSVALSAHQAHLAPGDAYLSVSEAPAWTLLERLLAVEPAALDRIVRDATT